jgi:hypothetical protein
MMLDVYLETTPKRAIAGALAWPGWARSGKTETAAIAALLGSAPRYHQVVTAADIDFVPPGDPADINVVEIIPGDGATEFGVPGKAPATDARPLDETELARLLALLVAYWRAFDAACAAAGGKELRKGPRGGGRELPGIVEHVVGAEHAYISSIAYKWDKPKTNDPFALLAPTRDAVTAALTAAARGETPTHRPRGGPPWSPRYFMRRAGWHVLDHTWEIEERLNLGSW